MTDIATSPLLANQTATPQEDGNSTTTHTTTSAPRGAATFEVGATAPHPSLDDDMLPDPESVIITDDAGVAELLWCIRRIEAKVAAVDAVVDAEIARITEWGQRRTAADRQRSDAYRGIAAEVLRAQRAANGRKSIATPHGTVRSRSKPGRWAYDYEEVLRWAEEHAPETVERQVVCKVDLSLLKRLLTTSEGGVLHRDGDVVPITIEEGETSFWVEVGS